VKLARRVVPFIEKDWLQ